MADQNPADYPIGTNAFPAFERNVENLDVAVVDRTKENFPDRKGVPRYTYHGIEQRADRLITGQDQRFNGFMVSSESAFSGFMGQSRDEFQRFLGSSGFSGWDRLYGPGITLNSHNEGFMFCDSDGSACLFFTPKSDTPLPYTTTGNWASESGKFTAQNGDTPLRQDLANPTKGASLVFGALRYIQSVNALSETEGRYHGDTVFVTSYHPGWGASQSGPEGGGIFSWDSLSTKNPDGGTVFYGPDQSQGRWLRKVDDSISAECFGARGDDLTDDFLSIDNLIRFCRSTNTPGTLSAKQYRIGSGSFDISGLTLSGVYRGHRNAAGTRLIGDGTATVLRQAQLTTPNQYFDIKNIRLEGANVGVETRYPLYSRLTNIDIFHPSGTGFILGDSAIDAGPLGLYADCVRVINSVGPALLVRGKEYNNSSVFFRCWFQTMTPTEACVDIDVPSGYGALGLRFVKSQTSGVGAGFNIKRASGLVLDQMFMETQGPAIRLLGSCLVDVRSPIFGSLQNDNAFSEPNYIHHVAGTGRITVNNPWVTLGSGDEQSNLSLMGSDLPSSFFPEISGKVAQAITASGWEILRPNLVQANLLMDQRSDFTPTWTATGGSPALGNGSLTMTVNRNGNTITATLRLVFGSTTVPGGGGWSFSLPAPIRSVGSAFGYALSSGARHTILASLSGSVISFWIPNTAAPVSQSQPFAWKSGDSLVCTFTYQL